MKYLFLVLLVCFSCTRISPHTKAGLTIINTHFKEMRVREGWVPESIGGSFCDNIVMLTATFLVEGDDFNISSSRKKIIQGSELFLSQINQNEKLIPHLNHYPFTNKDIEYGVSIYTKEGKWLGYVSLIKGNLYFSKVNELGNLERIHKESYLEALEKLKSSSKEALEEIK